MTDLPLTPAETARRDQYLAEGADMAADPGNLVILTDFAPPGIDCSWCDCPDDDPVHASGGRCAGCPESAVSVVHVDFRSPAQRSVPVCKSHEAAVLRYLVTHLAAQTGLPVELHHRQVAEVRRTR